jgi:hypothetical protein
MDTGAEARDECPAVIHAVDTAHSGFVTLCRVVSGLLYWIGLPILKSVLPLPTLILSSFLQINQSLIYEIQLSPFPHTIAFLYGLADL